ncbi:MAG TPA: polysaccharide deacetylase family protein [Paludibacter sp.]
MTEIINYILGFLSGEQVSPDIIAQIGYTSDSKEFHRYKLVILPSPFFDNNFYGTELSLPQLPLQIWEETPILFGQPTTETIGETIILHADIVASTYFLITRYEEMIRRDYRDIHGRFPGSESLPYRAGFIDSPLVEEYGKILRSHLRKVGCEVAEPPKNIRKVYLTHDLDQLAHYRNIRGFMGGLLRGIRRPKEGNRAIRSFWGGLHYDPWYTFPWLFTLDNAAKKALGTKRCETILFIRAGGGIGKEDQPIMLFHTPDFQTLIKLCKEKNITLGLHASYEAGIYPKRITDEKKHLDRISKKKTLYNRHHYLDTREPEDMQALIDAKISDDFTLGYADVAGFRLGTCRSVKWINPITQKLTSLTLHPLTIMDSSLSDKRYMFLNAHEAYEYCIQLINVVESWNGELVILWHNTSVEKIPQSYHRNLYEKLIEYLKTK